MQVARRSDVDMNGHINNVTYIAWALETVPRDVYYNYELQQVLSAAGPSRQVYLKYTTRLYCMQRTASAPAQWCKEELINCMHLISIVRQPKSVHLRHSGYDCRWK